MMFNLKNTLTFLFLFISLGAGSFVLINFYKTRGLSVHKTDVAVEDNSKINIYKDIMLIRWKLEGSKLNPNAKLFNDEMKEIEFGEIYDNKTNLLLFYNSSSCKDCINQELDYWNKLNPSFNLGVVVLFESLIQYKAYLSSWDYDFPVYYLSNKQELYDGFNPEIGVHVFFTLDGRLSHPHLASSSFPELSELYYSFIQSID